MTHNNYLQFPEARYKTHHIGAGETLNYSVTSHEGDISTIESILIDNQDGVNTTVTLNSETPWLYCDDDEDLHLEFKHGLPYDKIEIEVKNTSETDSTFIIRIVNTVEEVKSSDWVYALYILALLYLLYEGVIK